MAESPSTWRCQQAKEPEHEDLMCLTADFLSIPYSFTLSVEGDSGNSLVSGLLVFSNSHRDLTQIKHLDTRGGDKKTQGPITSP